MTMTLVIVAAVSLAAGFVAGAGVALNNHTLVTDAAERLEAIKKAARKR
jgi:hypothetical protein